MEAKPSPTDVRISLNLDAEMCRRVENWWHSHQLASRNDAIRDLIRRGLETETTESKPP
jgi:metal-responsive CopG/Arc/MetJ family transcriptional regulator